MFGLFKKDPAKKLQKQYEKLLFDAMQLQRKGDIMGYSMTTQEAEKIREQIEALKEWPTKFFRTSQPGQIRVVQII